MSKKDVSIFPRDGRAFRNQEPGGRGQVSPEGPTAAAGEQRPAGAGSFQFISRFTRRQEPRAAGGGAGAQPQLRGGSPGAGSAAARRPATTQGDSNRGPAWPPESPSPVPIPQPGCGQASDRPRPEALTPWDSVAPHAALHPPAPGPASPQEPHERQPAPGTCPCPCPRPAPRRLHLRGAPVAEFVGDGFDAPGPGHRDVAALGAHVQPDHRHDWRAVRLRPGSGSAFSGRCARLPRGLTAPRSLRAPASRGQRRLAEGSPEAGGAGLDPQPLAPRCAP